jgi:hypothetical protein
MVKFDGGVGGLGSGRELCGSRGLGWFAYFFAGLFLRRDLSLFLPVNMDLLSSRLLSGLMCSRRSRS